MSYGRISTVYYGNKVPVTHAITLYLTSFVNKMCCDI